MQLAHKNSAVKFSYQSSLDCLFLLKYNIDNEQMDSKSYATAKILSSRHKLLSNKYTLYQFNTEHNSCCSTLLLGSCLSADPDLLAPAAVLSLRGASLLWTQLQAEGLQV